MNRDPHHPALFSPTFCWRLGVGYTLIELLVVLVIISVVASMAVLTVGHNTNKELQTFTQKIAQTLTLAEELALLKPATLGLMLSSHSFAFYEYHQTQTQASWEPLTDPELGMHEIPSDIQVDLQLSNQTTEPEQKQAELSSKRRVPAVIISTNGTLTPFVILIGKKNKLPRYQLIGHADGTVISRPYKG